MSLESRVVEGGGNATGLDEGTDLVFGGRVGGGGGSRFEVLDKVREVMEVELGGGRGTE